MLHRVHVIELAFVVGWAAFWTFWLVAAFSMKRGRIAWSRELRIRVLIAVAVVVMVRIGVFRHHEIISDAWRSALGLTLFGLGLGFATRARLHIGRNWGTPMSEKDEPELVTSGPYRIVRHPIYTGIVVAAVGTAVALSWLWLAVVVLMAGYFVYAAVVEERYLTAQFPDAFPAYWRSTWMLVPFVF